MTRGPRPWWRFVLAALACGAAPPLSAQGVAEPSPWPLCRAAIERVEREAGLPPRLMLAIGRVESGRREPLSGRIEPWPWAINTEGAGRLFDTKAQAVAQVAGLLARGVRSIDIGCMQVNLHHHPAAFASLDAAFDPETNVRYAARFLLELRARLGDWAPAIAHYHSASPERGAAYQARVLAAWRGEGGDTSGVTPLAGGTEAARDPYVIVMAPAAALVQVVRPLVTRPPAVQNSPLRPALVAGPQVLSLRR